jgi:hypothetical protein
MCKADTQKQMRNGNIFSHFLLLFSSLCAVVSVSLRVHFVTLTQKCVYPRTVSHSWLVARDGPLLLCHYTSLLTVNSTIRRLQAALFHIITSSFNI